LKPYRPEGGLQIPGEKIIAKFAEADRLEAGGLCPIGGKLTKTRAGKSPSQRDARAKVSDGDQTGPQPGHPEVLSGRQSSIV
jgi:hypothetical protein